VFLLAFCIDFFIHFVAYLITYINRYLKYSFIRYSVHGAAFYCGLKSMVH